MKIGSIEKLKALVKKTTSHFVGLVCAEIEKGFE